VEYNESLQFTANRLKALIFNEAGLNKAAYGLLFPACLLLMVFSLLMKNKNRWESTYFTLLCASVAVWTACSFFALRSASSRTADLLYAIRFIGVIPIPALLCMHIRWQVSYKERRVSYIVLLFSVPVLMMLLVCRDVFFPAILRVFPLTGETLWYALIFYSYAAAALIRSYLLCFNVLYQMPRRTRRSTHFMLVGVSSASLLFGMNVLWTGSISALASESGVLSIILPLGAPLAFCLMLFPLYNALRVMPATDVIVTSREFVMGSLDTTVLVMNRKRQILDWNRKDWQTGSVLPKPLYREPFEVYRKRLLALGSYRVSSYSSDVIIVANGDREAHFLLSEHEASNDGRSFGFVLEITEITPIYTMLRYFEEIAYYDTLTGLHNRNAYLDCVKGITREGNMPLLIFVGDVNYLKTINDTYGHMTGDHLLRTVAEIIRKAMPPGAFAARVGGDEFVLLAARGSVEMADSFVQAVITQCEGTFHEEYGAPSISWGYAIMTSAEQSYNDAFEKADAMMYEYKKTRHGFRSSGLLPDSETTRPEP